ncbi:MAG: hypothetical protein AAGC77_02185 [Pseudomonadota bacterium]
MDKPANAISFPIGIASMAVAAAALILAVAHISFGPFAPQKPIEETIVDTAFKIKDAAQRAVSGKASQQGEPTVQSRWNVDRLVDVSVFVLASVAILLALIALLRNEKRSIALMGFSLGVGVLLMSWLQWIALLVCGAIIIAAIVNNLDALVS